MTEREDKLFNRYLNSAMAIAQKRGNADLGKQVIDLGLDVLKANTTGIIHPNMREMIYAELEDLANSYWNKTKDGNYIYPLF